MAWIRVPGLSRLVISCTRDFPPGCGPNAVLVDQNPSLGSAACVAVPKPLENGFCKPERSLEFCAAHGDAKPGAVSEESEQLNGDLSRMAVPVGEEVRLNGRLSVGMIIDNLPLSAVATVSGQGQVEEASTSNGVLSVGTCKENGGYSCVGMVDGNPQLPGEDNVSGSERMVAAKEEVATGVSLKPTDSMSLELSFSCLKDAPPVTSNDGKGTDGSAPRDTDMDVTGDLKVEEAVVLVSLERAVSLDLLECSRKGQVEAGEAAARKELMDGKWKAGKKFCSRKYPPPRAVSAVRDFPVGCGPNAPLMSREECLRLVAGIALSEREKDVEKSSNEKQLAVTRDLPGDVLVDRMELKDRTSEDSSSRSKTSFKGVPVADQHPEQPEDLAIYHAVADVPLEQIEKWNNEANRREEITKRITHETPIQHLNPEKGHTPSTKYEFGFEKVGGKGKISARKSTNNLLENSSKNNGIMKRKFEVGVKNEQASDNQNMVSPKLDGEKLVVQALMAAKNCPWRQGGRLDASSSRFLTPNAKLKRKETSNGTKLALNGIEDYEEPPAKMKSIKKPSFNKMADANDFPPQYAEAERSIVVYQQPNEFSITLPPVTPAMGNGDRSNEEFTPRQQVKRALKQFNTLFRKLLHQEESKPNKSSGKARIDLIVADKLKESGAFVNRDAEGIIGEVPGVEVGDEFGYRVELAVVGLHRVYQGGIDFAKRKGMNIAISVVSSGGYHDDMENPDVLVYTGSGGKPANAGKPAEDQKLERGNLGLKNCIDAGTPVRVIHGFKETKTSSYGNGKSKAVTTLTYAGLYFVNRYWQEKGPDGFLVYKFELVRKPGQPELALNQIKQSKSKAREGQCVSDISQGKERLPICAINIEDKDLPPSFKYLTKIKYPSSHARAPAKGCDCTGSCTDSGNCSCARKNGGEIPYNFNGAIVQAKRLLYECGPSCKCSKSCPNRVSQHGIKIPLEIFKTKTMGWGVRSLSSIASGTFICEYVGELIEDKEAERRNNDEYFFDIGNNYEDNTVWEGIPDATPSSESTSPSEAENSSFTIDAAECGNVGRFINHCCTPNLYAQNVLYDHDDKRMPHIMFFAAENIPPLQELTYHYNYAVGEVRDADGNIKRKDCYCGSAECTGRLY